MLNPIIYHIIQLLNIGIFYHYYFIVQVTHTIRGFLIMGVSNDKTIMYRKDSSIIELSDSQRTRNDFAVSGIPDSTRESTAPELFPDSASPEPDPITDSTSDISRDADTKINQSNYLRYLADLRRSDSELALAKAESAELVRLVDSYKEHYTEYEKLIRTLVVENNSAVSQQLDTIETLAQRIKKTSNSLNKRIDKEIQRLTFALAQSIQTNVKDSCNKELAKVSAATEVLYDYSLKVKQQYRKFERLEGLKFALFVISSIASPIALILLALNLFLMM